MSLLTITIATENYDRVKPLIQSKQLMGRDFWRYGFRENLPELPLMTQWSFEQGLSARRLQPAELFHPATHDCARV